MPLIDVIDVETGQSYELTLEQFLVPVPYVKFYGHGINHFYDYDRCPTFYDHCNCEQIHYDELYPLLDDDDRVHEGSD